MGWFILSKIISVLIAMVNLDRSSEQDKYLEILVLRLQVAVLSRKRDKPIKPKQADKMTLAILTENYDFSKIGEGKDLEQVRDRLF